MIHAAVFVAAVLAAPAAGWAQACTKQQIAAVIDATGERLRKLNGELQPAIQAKLRQLGQKRGWSDAEAEQKGYAFVEDGESRSLDEQASQLVIQLDELGDDSATKLPLCARVSQLRTTADQLVEVTTAKAAHVSARLDAALRGDAPQPAAPHHKAEAPVGHAEKAEPKVDKAPRPAAPPQASQQRPPPKGEPAVQSQAWSSETKRDDALVQPGFAPGMAKDAPPPPRDMTAMLPPRMPDAADLEFTSEDITAAGRGFFGSISAGLASVFEYAFRSYGRPNGYILGTEGGGAFLAGLRYGDGTLVMKNRGERRVFWQGPSVGYDVGLAGSRVMFLVYNLRDDEDMFARFVGVDGSAYLVGGVGITFLKKGSLVLAPIRTGLGLRVGANIGYLKFTPQPSLNPF
jgi:hypothetical protein